MKNLLKFILAAVFLIGAVPADTIVQESVAQETTKQCYQITLADAEDIKKKKKKKGKKIKKGKKKKKGFFSKFKGAK
jgi:hypothetical protein